MKKSIALLGLLAAFATTASAQTVIRITGSTAFRGATNTAIGNILQPGFTFGYAGATFSSSNQTIFTGTTKAPTNTPVIIKASWTGATGGIKTIVQNVPIPTWLVNTTPQSAAGTANAPATYDPAVTADVAFADTFQNTTEFRTPVMTSRVIGVIPFQWIRGNGSPNTISNMNTLLAASLLSGGLPLSQFTGNPADQAVAVYATGRDEDSGTRTATFAESLFGVFSSCTQFQPVISGGVITDLVPWPPATVLGTNYPLGHSGFPGGGQLITAINTPGASTNPSNPGHLVTYAGINDAANALAGVQATATATVTGGAVTALTVGNGGTNYNSNPAIVFSGGGGTGAAATAIVSAAGVITGFNITNGGTGYTSAPTVAIRGGATLTWNGFEYSAANVREGRYTFWSYEALMYRPGYAQSAIADQLANQIKNFDAALSGIALSTMNVGRAVEGGPVTPGNPFP